MFRKHGTKLLVSLSLVVIFAMGFSIASIQKYYKDTRSVGNSNTSNTADISRPVAGGLVDVISAPAVSSMQIKNESRFKKMPVDGNKLPITGDCNTDQIAGVIRLSTDETYSEDLVYSAITNPTRDLKDAQSVESFVVRQGDVVSQIDSNSAGISPVESFFKDYCVGGSITRYVREIDSVNVDLVESYRSTVVLTGQSEFFNPTVMIIGKKNGYYFKMSKVLDYNEVAKIATSKKCPLPGSDFNDVLLQPYPCMREITLSDPAVGKLLLDTAIALRDTFVFEK
jgi:hypothetical protein